MEEGANGTLAEGYATEDCYYWVCAKCFDELRDAMGWRLAG